MSEHSIESLASRLSKVERQNRRLKVIGGVALLLIGALFLMGQVSSPKTVRAHAFVVLDKDGEVCGYLSGDRGGPSLGLGAKEGGPFIRMHVLDNGDVDLLLQGRKHGSILLSIGPERNQPLMLIGKKNKILWAAP